MATASSVAKATAKKSGMKSETNFFWFKSGTTLIRGDARLCLLEYALAFWTARSATVVHASSSTERCHKFEVCCAWENKAFSDALVYPNYDHTNFDASVLRRSI
ncbi:hypothetical protein TgHK011_004627 [Trichoderma gracile]|nr:hypothetical protein TgHK011_004627 [Trichoderma gracile]